MRKQAPAHSIGSQQEECRLQPSTEVVAFGPRRLRGGRLLVMLTLCLAFCQKGPIPSAWATSDDAASAPQQVDAAPQTPDAAAEGADQSTPAAPEDEPHAPAVTLEVSDQQTGMHLAPRAGTRTLTVAVSYEGLTPGLPYTLVLGLHARNADGSDAGHLCNPAGEPLVTVEPLLAEAAQGKLERTLSFDADTLETPAVMVFADLMEGDAVVARSDDPQDARRTVAYPQLTATLVDEATSSHLSQASASTTLIETVIYQGLEPQQTYTCTSSLYRADALGKEGDGAEPLAHATASFVPTAAEGTVALTFTLDTTKLIGADLGTRLEVSFLREEGHDPLTVATCEASAANPPLRIMQLTGQLSNRTDGSCSISPTTTADLVDSVHYRGLVPGTAYELVATLHALDALGNDNGPLTDAHGTPITVRRSFTAPAAEGSEELSFSFDASALSASKLMCVEELYENSLLVATHLPGGTGHEPSCITVEEAGAAAYLTHEGQAFPPFASLAVGATVLGGTSTAVLLRRRHLHLPYAQRRRRRHYVA